MNADCARLEDRAAELAFGIVDEPELSDLLQHLDECDRCRRLVDELSVTADRVLLAAPEVEPPAGFESEALKAMGLGDERSAPARQPNLRSPVRAVVVSAAAVLLAIVGAIALERTVGPEPANPAEVTASATLRSDAGDDVGRAVVVDDGSARLLVMTLDVATAGEHYDCTIVLADGSHQDIGTWSPRGDNHVWSVPLAGSAADVRQLVVADTDGSSVSTAQLD